MSAQTRGAPPTSDEDSAPLATRPLFRNLLLFPSQCCDRPSQQHLGWVPGWSLVGSWGKEEGLVPVNHLDTKEARAEEGGWS